MKQPALGIISSILVIAVSLGFIAIFPLAAFITWVSTLLICLIPMVIVIGVVWRGQHPAFAARRRQPARGLLFLLLAAAAGAVVAVAHDAIVGGLISPPTPILSMCLITSVPIAFWLAIIWGGWPFASAIRSPIAAGLAILAASYLVNYLFFRLFFGFRFLADAPAAVAALDPRGLFDAWNVLVFEVTAAAAMFLLLGFDLWPFSTRPALMRQPVLGMLWTAFVLVIAAAAFSIGKGLLGMDAPVFMVRFPIPFIFGTIIVSNMMERSLFAGFSQPLKGLLNTAAAAIIGGALAALFAALSSIVSGRIPAGRPDYVFEIWIASALLAVTFPFLIIFADLLQFWPLKRTDTARERP